MGSAGSFAVLAGSGVTNKGATDLSGSAGGDIGSYPTPTFTGEPSVTSTGENYLEAGETPAEAQESLKSAYNDGVEREATREITPGLAARTLTSGVYHSNDVLTLGGVLTLDGEGDADATFIFQAGSTLTTTSESRMELINGAQACNVFWLVGSSAALGTDSSFVGHLMAVTSITAATNATVEGQLLAQHGAVTLDTNTIVNKLCAEPVEPIPEETEDIPEETEDIPQETEDIPQETEDIPEEGTEGASLEGESVTAPHTEAPEPAPHEATVDGGILPNTGGIEWIIGAIAGLALATAGTVAYLRTLRRR